MSHKKTNSSKDLQEVEEFARELRLLSLGDLIDKLIQYRLEELSVSKEDESITDKSKRTIKINALKQEVSKRETGRDNGDTSVPKGVTSLGSLF